MLRTALFIAVALSLSSFAFSQVPNRRNNTIGVSPAKTLQQADRPPVFALATATQGLSRDFGLDGPHWLTYVTLASPDLIWEAKDKTRDWRFDQTDTRSPKTITIYLGGPQWHQDNESIIVRADGKKLDKAIDELLSRSTPVLISLSGKPVSEMYLKALKPETLVVVLGARDLELKPTVIDSSAAEQSHALEPATGEVSNGKSSPPAQ